MRSIHITFDIDWCPDFMIEYLLDILKNDNIRCTFFLTHETKINKKIYENHDIGIHPNFLESKSIKNQINTVDKLIKILPPFKFIRTHALFMNSNLLHQIFMKYKFIERDFSLLTYGASNIEEFKYYFKRRLISRMNYNWEDSIALHEKNMNWKKFKYFGKKNIYNFHPIHIFYNTKNFNHYQHIKLETKNLKNQKLKNINKKLINNKGSGVRTLLLKIINQGKIKKKIYI